MRFNLFLSCSVVLFFLAIGNGNGQTKRIDSLKQAVRAAASKEKRLENLFLLCEERQSMPADTLYRFALQADEIAAGLHLHSSLTAKYYLYTCLLKNGKPDSVIKNCNDALALLKSKSSNKELELKFLHLKMLSFMRSNEYGKAIKQNFDLLHKAELYQDTLMQVKAKNSIGWAYMEMNQYKDAVSWFKKSLESSANKIYYDKYTAVYSNLASSYNNLGRFDSAFYFINETLRAVQVYEDLTSQANALNIKADILINTNKPIDAEKLLKQALEIRMRIGDAFYVVSDLYQLAVFYAHNGQAVKGIATAVQGIETARRYNLNAKLPLLYSGLAESYKMAGDIKNYASTLERIIGLKDTLFEKNSAEALAELQSRYDVQKNENIIMQQKIGILKRDYFITGAIAFFFLLIFSAYYFYRSYKKRHGLKLNRILYEQKEKETHAVSEAEENQRKRIAAELHDNLGAQISFISSNIDWIIDSPKPLSEAEQKKHLQVVHDSSHSLMQTLRDTIWALNRDKINLDEFADKLKSYIQAFLQFKPHLHFEAHEQMNSTITLNPLQALNLFRIFQEAVNNSIKYAKAANLLLTISTTNANFEIILADDGKGFDPNNVLGEHYGLKNMEYRAAEAGFKFALKSKPDSGTEVRVGGLVITV